MSSESPKSDSIFSLYFSWIVPTIFAVVNVSDISKLILADKSAENWKDKILVISN